MSSLTLVPHSMPVANRILFIVADDLGYGEPPAATAAPAPAEVELSEARRPAKLEFDL